MRFGQDSGQGCPPAITPVQRIFRTTSLSTAPTLITATRRSPATSARPWAPDLEPAADRLDDHLAGPLEARLVVGDELEDPAGEQLLDRAVEPHRREASASMS